MTTPAWPYTGMLDLEGHPTFDQQERLEDFLHELTFISRKYGMLIDSYGDFETPVIRDVRTGHIVGLQMSYFVDPHEPDKIIAYDCAGSSILDGVWLVDTADGETRELRDVDGRAMRVRKHQHTGAPRA